MKYIRRIVDNKIDLLMTAFNAINIVGPKGCGKTRTSSERCKTIIEFQDEEKRDGYIATVQDAPFLMLNYPKPILFDEWQDAPKIWGAIRKACDDSDNVGEFFLTGSTSKKIRTPHTGTGRITTLTMYPMSLYESGESNGTISLTDLLTIKDYNIDGKCSNLNIKQLVYATCRGGWPRAINLNNELARLEIAKDYFKQICEKDISAIDNRKRNSVWTRSILWSYARNIATTVKTINLYNDVKSNYPLSDTSFYEYVDALERLYVIKDIEAWIPQIRSKTSIRATKKRIFIDPSIAIATLGLSPEYFYSDFDLFGHIFENVVIRDLLSFAEAHSASVKHYHDDSGLEIDAIYQLSNGEYAIIEIKTGTSSIQEADKNLNKFTELIKEYNKKNPELPYKEPKQMIIICGTIDMAYTTKSGVKVIPIGCLKD